MNLVEYIKRQIEWSRKNFGTNQRTFGLTAHIRKELLEIEQKPLDVTEWVDVMILAIDGAWRAGYSAERIADELQKKQEKNFLRTWVPQSDDKPNEHTRGTHD